MHSSQHFGALVFNFSSSFLQGKSLHVFNSLVCVRAHVWEKELERALEGEIRYPCLSGEIGISHIMLSFSVSNPSSSLKSQDSDLAFNPETSLF